MDQHLAACEACARAVRVLALHRAMGQQGTTPSMLGVAATLNSDRGASPGDAPVIESTVFLSPEGRYQSPAGGIVELGAGGLGRVLSVRDTAFGREVALKEIAVTPGPGPTHVRDRFVREARLAGQLEHPGIVPVYDFARDASGRLFYVMRRIVGRTLGELISEAPALGDRLALVPHVLAMAQAVAYAHSRGVLHRDVKPQNVMVGPFGETLLLDWGLARAKHEPGAVLASVNEDEPTFSRRGAPIGTPAYMSPEQALGKLEEVDEQSDLWMLGATLFHVLTGRPPFAEQSLEAALTKARAGAVPAIATLQPDVPPELAAIATRCLAREKAARYPDVVSLVKDLESWLAGRPVSAHAYSARELARRFVRAYRLPLAVAATLLVTLGVAVTVGDLRVRRERDDYRALSMFVLSETVEAIRQTPGKRQLVVELAKRVRETLERSSWLDASVADRRVLHTAVFTSGTAQLEAGHLAEAEESLRYAIKLSDSLLKEEVTATLLADGALDRANLASTLQAENRLTEAEQLLEASMAMVARARELEANNREVGTAEELTLSLKIRAAADQGKYLEAIPWAKRGLEVEAQNFAGQVLRARDHYNRVLGYDQLTEMCQETGQRECAREAFGHALEALASFEAEYPSSLDFYDAAFDARYQGALLEFEAGHRAQALAHLEEGMKAADRLIETEPNNAEYLSRRVVLDFHAGSVERMRADLDKLAAMPSIEGTSDLAVGAMLIAWPPERMLLFVEQHPELVTKDARLHVAIAMALSGPPVRAHRLAQQIADDPLQPFHWSEGLVAQRVAGLSGAGPEAVRVLARELDASVSPRNPARRRAALQAFAQTLGALARDGG